MVGSEGEIVRAILDSWPGSRGEVLMVHSSFRRFGEAGLQPERFCQALIDAMAGGTVLMPTMTWRSVTPANPVFDVRHTHSHTGLLTETFRTGFATARSLHPTHSVAGYGALAKLLLASHHLGDTPCPGGSPYGLMRDYNSHILMLGTGLETCTAFHHVEEIIAPNLYVRPVTEAEPYDLIDDKGNVHRVTTRRHRRLPRNFPKFEPLLRAEGRLTEGSILSTRWMLFSTRDLYQMLFRALIERPDAFLAEPSAET